jgi:hypothetical protein
MSNSPRSARRVLQIITGALAFSLLSLVITDTRSAGMGTHRSYGFPRPFYFRWVGIDGGAGSNGVNWLYFLENWLIYAVALAAIVAVVHAIHAARAGNGERARDDVARP